MTPLSQEVIDGLSPGIRDLVIMLNEAGFETTDSGDGSNHAQGMACAPEHPMVAILVRPEGMVSESRRLKSLIEQHGLNFEEARKVQDCADGSFDIGWPDIQASYSPVDDVAVLVLLNVTSKDVGLGDENR